MRVFVSCGEPSGLLFGGLLAQALERSRPGVQVEIARFEPVLGFWEGVKAAGALRKRLAATVEQVRETRPDLVVLVAFPGFNLKLGRQCRRLGIPVVYLAPPQVWAWGRWRIPALRQAADKVVCLFPFEQQLLQEAGVDATFLGYPLFDVLDSPCLRSDVIGRLGWKQDARYVLFLPGSRPAEVAYHRPLFELVAGEIERETGLRTVIADAPSDHGLLDSLSARYGLISHAECAVVVSGTATLETALLGVPQVVCYHLSPLTRAVARLLVRGRFFSLPNILLRRQAVPELLEPTATQVLSTVRQILDEPASGQAARDYRSRLRQMLGPAGVMDRIGQLVVETTGSG